jgi:hypothetical protein
MSGPVLSSIVAALLAQTPTSGGSAIEPVNAEPTGAPAPPPSLQPAPPDSAGERPTHWYGAPIVAADVATIGLLYSTGAYSASYDRSYNTGWPGATAAYAFLGAAYLFDGAVVHALHHRPSRAGQSVLLRLGGVVAGVGTTAAVLLGGSCLQGMGDYSTFPGASGSGQPAYCYAGLASLVVFPLAAMAIDDIYLARAPVEEAPAPHASVAPSLVVRPGLALLGLGARF